MDSKHKQTESKDAGAPIVVDYMKNKYNQYDKDRDTTKVGLPSVVREPKKLDFSWDKVVDEKKKDSSGPVLKEQDILAFLMTASGNESGKSQYLNLVEAAGKNVSPTGTKSSTETVENITKDMTKNVRSMFEKGETSASVTKTTPKRISLIEDSSDTTSVFENVPVARSDDIIKSGEPINDGEQVQKGTTKSLLDQWQKKGEDRASYVSANKSLIKLVDDSSVNEEAIESSKDESDIIQKGIAKSLLNQWNSQTFESSYKPPEKAIQIVDRDKKDDHTLEDGLERTKGDTNDVEVVQKGSTKTLLNQWNEKKNETFVSPKQTIVMVEPGTKELKLNTNEKLESITSPPASAIVSTKLDSPNKTSALPVQTSDVPVSDVKQAEETKEEEIDLDSLQKGLAKAMVLQWKSDHPDESLDDIIQNATKATGSYNESLSEKGIDKTLYDQWKYVKFKHLPKLVRDKKPLVINVPEKRTRPTVAQVLASKSNDETITSPGSTDKTIAQAVDSTNNKETNDLSSPKISQSEEPPIKPNESFEMTSIKHDRKETPLSNDKKEHETVANAQPKSNEGSMSFTSPTSRDLNETFEDDPATKSEIIKASDSASIDRIEKGFAKNALEQLKQTLESSKIERKPITILPDDGKISENEPKSSGITSQLSEPNDSQPVVQQGMTKHLLGQWQNKQNETFQYSKRRIIVDENEEAMADTKSTIVSDAIKPSDESPKIVVEKGMAKNIMNQLVESSKNKEITKLHKIVIAETDGVVAENEPANRDDIAKKDDQLPSALNVVQQGITKNLLGQWNKITTEPLEKIKKEPVNLVLDSGHVSENEPIKRTDVVSSEPTQTDEIEKIEKGFTKSLLTQWQNQNVITSTAKNKTKVEIREEDGSVSENIPQTLDNIAREGETLDQNKSIVQSGIAKSLVGQWQNKKLESFKSEKSPIVIANDEGQCAENEPITRDNVIRSDQINEETVVEKGYTKNILNQWQTMPLKSNVVKDKTPITISEQDGAVVENEPIQRTDVVKSGVDLEETIVQKGFTKSLLNQWHEKKETPSHSQKSTRVEIREEDGQCVENEPAVRSDVVRSSDNAATDEVTVGKGYTMNMLNQWQQNSNERSSDSSRDKTPIVISYEDGKVAENVPVQRDDVAREGDTDVSPIHIVQSGTAKQLKNQWQNIGSKTFEKENKTPVAISEDDGRVAESQPIERTDVVKGDQTDNDISFAGSGLTKSLLGHWKNKQSEEFTSEKKMIKIVEDDGHIAENEPIIRKDVVKEDSNIENTSIVQKGTTKQLLNRWKNPESTQKSLTKTVVQISKEDGVVAENEPAVRDDIIKAEDAPEETNKIVQKGIAKSLTSQWNTGNIIKSNKQDKKVILELDSGHVAENDPSPKRTDVFREVNQEENTDEHMPLKGQASLIKQKLISVGQQKISSSRREPINIYDTNPNEKCVAENEPVKREGVAREDDENYADNVTVLKKGYAKNMAGFWTQPKFDSNQNLKKQPVIELAEGPAVYENEPQPSMKHEIKQVLEAGVFENDPVTREDVAREADFQPEVISAHITRNIRKLWSQKENESANPVVKTKKPKPVRFTPPREKSPPPQIKEEFKSTHTLTFKKP